MANPNYESIDSPNYEIANTPDYEYAVRPAMSSKISESLEEQNMRSETGGDEKPDNYLEVTEGELRRKSKKK